MAGIIKYDDLIHDDGSFEKIMKHLEELEQKLLLMAKGNKESLIGINPSDVKQMGKAIGEYDKLKKQLASVQKQMKELKEVKKKDKIVTEEQILAQEKSKLEMQQMRKKAKELAKEQAGLTSEYSKQSKELRKLKNQYKDMVLAGDGATEQAKELHAEITELDTTLRELDKSVGDSYREIGKYEEALENVIGGLKETVTGFRLFGVSVGDVGRVFSLFGDLVAPITGRLKDYSIAVLQSVKQHGVFGSVMVGLRKGFTGVIKSFRRGTKALKENIKATRTAIKEQGILAVTLRAVKSASRGVASSMKVLKVALISTGIGALVVALGSAVAMFTKMQVVVDRINQDLAGLKAGFDTIISRLGLLGTAFKQQFQGNFAAASQTAKKAVNGLGAAIVTNAKAGKALAKQTQALTRAMRDYAIDVAKVNRLIERQNAIAG